MDRAHGKWYGDACAAAFAMELVGERWTLLIIRELMLGARRFSDIRASLPGMSAKVLTERLERLEELGIVVRSKLPPPASSQVYELTQWGYELEDVMQALGRWSVRSPLHDPSLHFTPVSFLLSLRTMICPEKAKGMRFAVEFRTEGERLFAVFEDGQLVVERGGEGPDRIDVIFSADGVGQFLGVIYGKRPAEECGVTIEGEETIARQFIDMFTLPSKHAFPASVA